MPGTHLPRPCGAATAVPESEGIPRRGKPVSLALRQGAAVRPADRAERIGRGRRIADCILPADPQASPVEARVPALPVLPSDCRARSVAAARVATEPADGFAGRGIRRCGERSGVDRTAGLPG